MKKKIFALFLLVVCFFTFINVKALNELSGLEPGLYDDENNLVASWDKLIDDYGMNIATDESNDYYYDDYNNTWIHYFQDINGSWHDVVIDFDDVPSYLPFKILMSPELSSGTRLKISDDVKKIGKGAFYNSNLKIVSIPSSVLMIGEYAFYQYPIVLEKVYFENGEDWELDGYTYSADDLSDPEYAANLISNYYYYYTWYSSLYNPFEIFLNENKEHIIEFLSSKYNVVTLGTKDKNSISSFPYDTTEYRRGSVVNSYSIGGPLLIRGDLITHGGDGYAVYQDTWGVDVELVEFYPEILRVEYGYPSYIGGIIEGGQIPSSTDVDLKMGRWCSWGCDGNDFTLYVNTDLNTINGNYLNTFTNVSSGSNFKSNNNFEVDFDDLYQNIVDEQKLIPQGEILSFTNTNYLVNEEVVTVSHPGYYTIDLSSINGFPWKSKVINIENYVPGPYIFTVKGKYIYTPIEILINGESATDVTAKDAIYYGRNGATEKYYGNISINYPEAEYIYLSRENIGNIIAPKADVEINSWKIVGTIIANSITIENDYKATDPADIINNDTLGNTAIQSYPYMGGYILTFSLADTENEYAESNSYVYEGSYDLIDLIKNYNVITLGKNNISSNATLNNLTSENGTSRIPYVAAPILINGNFGVSNNEKADIFSYVSAYNNGNLFESSYIKGLLKATNSDNDILADLNYKMDAKEVYFGTGNSFLQTIGYHTPYWYSNDYNANIVSSNTVLPVNRNSNLNYVSNILGLMSNYKLYKPIFKTDSYIDFDLLYNNVIDAQATFKTGRRVSPDSDGILHLSYGATYTIEDINDVKTIIFDNPENKDKLTLINILESNKIDEFPKLLMSNASCDVNEILTNKYYNYHAKIYDSDTIINDEVYEGNIIWSIPNAKYINMSETSFVGHIIAPNADIEIPEMNVAGTIIANSVYALDNSEVHYYPYRLSSFDTENISVRIYNVDDLTREDISDFEYELYDGDNLIDSWVTCSECTKYHEILTLVPNKTYTLKQVSNTEPYIDVEPITFTIDDDGDVITSSNNTDIDSGNLLVLNVRKRTIRATIEWDDEDNKYGIRPTTVKVRLLANNTEIRSFDVTEDDLTIEATDLPLSKNGEEIEYRIAQDVIANYTSSDEHTVISSVSDVIRVDEYTIVNSYNDTDVLGEREENPYTGDRIDKSFVILAISVIGLLVALVVIFVLKKRKKK